MHHVHAPPWRLLPALLLVVLPFSARAGELVDLRVPVGLCASHRWGPDASAAASTLSSECGATEFYDHYDTRSDGLSEFAVTFRPRLDASADGAFTADAAVALAVPQLPTAGVLFPGSPVLGNVVDDSSFLRFAWHPDGPRRPTGLSLVLYPYSSDRLRLGFSRAISWGGDAMFFHTNGDDPSASAAPVIANPAVRFDVVTRFFEAFVAGKKSVVLGGSDGPPPPTTSTGPTVAPAPTGAVLGGVGGDLPHGVRLDVNGGYFNRGPNPKEGVLGKPVITTGGSVQLSWAHGDALARRIDLSLVTEDPTAPGRFLAPMAYAEGWSWVVSGEATWLATQLADPDATGRTTFEGGHAADLQLRLARGWFRLEATAMARDVPFELVEIPGFVPFQALSPASTVTAPDVLLTARADYRIPAYRVTPGLAAGFEHPAAIAGRLPPGMVTGDPPASTPIVVEGPGLLRPLSPCSAVDPICGIPARLGMKVFARVEILEGVLLGYVELHAARDLARVPDQANTPYLRTATPFAQFGGRASLVVGW